MSASWRRRTVLCIGLLVVVSIVGEDVGASILRNPSAVEPPVVEDDSVVAVPGEPLPESEPRDLAGELSVDVPMSDAELPPGAVTEEKRLDELVQLRSEGSETWRLESGRNVTEFFSTPKWFRDSRGGWSEVDPAVVAGKGETVAGVAALVMSTGVGFTVGFGVSGQGVGFVAEGREWRARVVDGASDVVPEIDRDDDQVVWYRGVREGVDVRYTLSATGVKEDFIVATPEALEASGDFGVEVVTGGVLIPDATFAGGFAVDWDGDGATGWQGKVDGPLVRLPAPLVTDSSEKPLTDVRSRFVVSERREVAGDEGASSVRVGMQLDGLDTADVEFPLVVDPAFEVIPSTMGGSWQSYNSTGGYTLGTNEWMLFGDWRVFGGTDYWRTNVHLGYSRLWTHVAANPRVFSANLKLYTVGGLHPAGPLASISHLFPSSNGSFPGEADPVVTACHASAWTWTGAYPGHDIAKCRSGYYWGYAWTNSVQGPEATTNRVDVTDMVRPWVAAKQAGNVIGVSAQNQVPAYNFKATAATLEVVWDQLTTAASLVGPANGASVTTLTPTLSTSTVTDPDAGQTPLYRAVLMASNPGSLADAVPEQGCGANAALWSSSWSSSPSFAVPAGVLADGVTYWWSMSTMGTVPGYPRCSGPWSFRVNRRLGDATPSPMETVGPVAVNLSTGNVSMSVGSNSVASVGGDIGVNLTYNSQASSSSGLRVSYHGGTPPFTGLAPGINAALADPPFLSQVDQKIEHNWGANGPGNVGPYDHFAARWTGYVTVPTAGSYCFRTRASDGTRVWINDTLVLNSWTDKTAPTEVACSSNVTFAAGETKAIKVEYYDRTGEATMHLKVSGPGISNQVVPTSWLSTD